jgi:hypothetical protein
MELYYILFYVTAALFGILLISKSYLFFVKYHFHRLRNWLYFSKYNIYNSKTPQKAKAKKTQNILSLVLIIFIILAVIFLLMIHFTY